MPLSRSTGRCSRLAHAGGSWFLALQSDPEPQRFSVPIHCSDPLTRASGARSGFVLLLLSASVGLDLGIGCTTGARCLAMALCQIQESQEEGRITPI
jgi:hypothetical protein